MTNSGSHRYLLGIAGALALTGFASGCTTGVLVDENFNNITDWRTTGASVTFQALDANLFPNGTNYSFNLNGQPYISLDAFGSDGATTPSFPGLVNSSQYVAPGNYRVQFFQPGVGFAYSRRFAHAYDTPGTCSDTFANITVPCAIYYFELNYHCPVCTGPNCGGIQTLPTHNGFPVIDLCISF